LILRFYLSPYRDDLDYDYDSWHGLSRNVFSKVYEQQTEPLIRTKKGSYFQYYHFTFY
jgi:hypothetical protein